MCGKLLIITCTSLAVFYLVNLDVFNLGPDWLLLIRLILLPFMLWVLVSATRKQREEIDRYIGGDTE